MNVKVGTARAYAAARVYRYCAVRRVCACAFDRLPISDARRREIGSISDGPGRGGGDGSLHVLEVPVGLQLYALAQRSFHVTFLVLPSMYYLHVDLPVLYNMLQCNVRSRSNMLLVVVGSFFSTNNAHPPKNKGGMGNPTLSIQSIQNVFYM